MDGVLLDLEAGLRYFPSGGKMTDSYVRWYKSLANEHRLLELRLFSVYFAFRSRIYLQPKLSYIYKVRTDSDN